jgi:hypothetical protein
VAEPLLNTKVFIAGLKFCAKAKDEKDNSVPINHYEIVIKREGPSELSHPKAGTGSEF